MTADTGANQHQAAVSQYNNTGTPIIGVTLSANHRIVDTVKNDLKEKLICLEIADALAMLTCS